MISLLPVKQSVKVASLYARPRLPPEEEAVELWLAGADVDDVATASERPLLTYAVGSKLVEDSELDVVDGLDVATGETSELELSAEYAGAAGVEAGANVATLLELGLEYTGADGAEGADTAPTWLLLEL